MLKTMRDATADERTRLEAAKAAAPFVHAKADGGKKARATEAARKIAEGRFAVPPGPKGTTDWGDDLVDPKLRDREYRQ